MVFGEGRREEGGRGCVGRGEGEGGGEGKGKITLRSTSFRSKHVCSYAIYTQKYFSLAFICMDQRHLHLHLNVHENLHVYLRE